jgi:hypothetical protein
MQAGAVERRCRERPQRVPCLQQVLVGPQIGDRVLAQSPLLVGAQR